MLLLWYSHEAGRDLRVCWGTGWHGDGDRRLTHLQSYGILDLISHKRPCRPLAALLPLPTFLLSPSAPVALS